MTTVVYGDDVMVPDFLGTEVDHDYLLIVLAMLGSVSAFSLCQASITAFMPNFSPDVDILQNIDEL